MKYFTSLSAALILLITTQAAAATNFISCPSFETIRANSRFSNPRLEDQTQNRWLLVSNIYKHNLAKWQTYIAVPLPGSTKKDDVITQGTAYFREKVTLSTPKRITDANSTYCYYTSPEQEYAVLALIPPHSTSIQYYLRSMS